jgi:hypothetical protein
MQQQQAAVMQQQQAAVMQQEDNGKHSTLKSAAKRVPYNI